MTKKAAREKVYYAYAMVEMGYPMVAWQMELRAVVKRDISRVSRTGTYKREQVAA